MVRIGVPNHTQYAITPLGNLPEEVLHLRVGRIGGTQLRFRHRSLDPTPVRANSLPPWHEPRAWWIPFQLSRTADLSVPISLSKHQGMPLEDSTTRTLAFGTIVRHQVGEHGDGDDDHSRLRS